MQESDLSFCIRRRALRVPTWPRSSRLLTDTMKTSWTSTIGTSRIAPSGLYIMVFDPPAQSYKWYNKDILYKTQIADNGSCKTTPTFLRLFSPEVCTLFKYQTIINITVDSAQYNIICFSLYFNETLCFCLIMFIHIGITWQTILFGKRFNQYLTTEITQPNILW